MKKKLILVAILVIAIMCMLAISISAAATNAFGTVETSTKIDLTGMAEDDDVYCVLYDGEEYHTYPSRYIVTNATTLTFDTSKINEAFGKNYNMSADKKDNDCVIRLQVPKHVQSVPSGPFNYGDSNKIIEVYFPVDSELKTIAWGAFENNTSIQKVNFPRSLEDIKNNAFCKCSALVDISFAEDSTIKEITGEKVFYQCSSLEELVFPNSLVKIGNSPFGVGSKLKKVVLGANMETLPGAMSDINAKGTVIYFSNKFYAPSVTTEPGANMFHWAGADGLNNNPKYLTFVYTGTKAEAEALQTRFGKVDGLQRLSEATLCSVEEYTTLTGLQVGVGSTTGNYLIYGYNMCKAFYNDVHPEKLEEGEVDTNLCMLTECDRCGITNVYVGNDSTHNMNTTYAYANYFVNGTITESCQNAGCIYHTTPKVDNETLTPFFKELKYSTRESGGVFGIYVEYKIDQNAIALYEVLSDKTVNYGVMAIKTSNITGNGPLKVDGTTSANYVVAADVTNNKLALAQLIITGNWAENSEIEITMLGFVTDGEELHYMGSQDGEAATGTAAGAFNAVTYNNIIE